MKINAPKILLPLRQKSAGGRGGGGFFPSSHCNSPPNFPLPSTAHYFITCRPCLPYRRQDEAGWRERRECDTNLFSSLEKKGGRDREMHFPAASFLVRSTHGLRSQGGGRGILPQTYFIPSLPLHPPGGGGGSLQKLFPSWFPSGAFGFAYFGV